MTLEAGFNGTAVIAWTGVWPGEDKRQIKRWQAIRVTLLRLRRTAKKATLPVALSSVRPFSTGLMTAESYSILKEAIFYEQKRPQDNFNCAMFS